MNKGHFRFTVISAALALLLGASLQPPTNVVRVDARGLGHEHAQPWRSKSTTAAAIALGALSLFAAVGAWYRQAKRQPWFRPAMALAAILLIALVLTHPLLALPVAFGVTSYTEGQHAGEFLMSERDMPGFPSRENITVLSGQNLKAGAVIGRVNKGIGRVSIPVVAGGTGTGTVSNVYAGPEVEVGNYVLTCITAVADGGVFTLTAPSGRALPNLTMTPGAGGTTKYRSRHINFTITDATDFIVTNSFTFVVSTTAPTVIGGTGTGTISALALGPEAKAGNYRVICTAAVTNGGVFQVYRGGPDGGESLGIFTQTPGSGGASVFETREITFTITDAADFIVGNYFDVCVFNQLADGKVVAWDPTTFDGRNIAVGALYDNVDATSSDLPGVIVTRDAVFDRAALQYGAAISVADKTSAERDLAKRNIIVR